MLILVTGANGQLGKSIQSFSIQNNTAHNFVFASRDNLDLSCFDDIEYFIKAKKFDLIINCAAYTNVDEAEENQNEAVLINYLAVKKIAEVAYQRKIKLIHISTDFVFDGFNSQPYKENDVTNPLNFYGKTKLSGENAILSIMKFNAIIIRTSWMYSEYGNNFVDTIMKLSLKGQDLKIVDDQTGNPTYAKDLVSAIFSILDNKKYIKFGQLSTIFHFSNEGACSWYDFAVEIINLSKCQIILHPIKSKDYTFKAQRPKYVSMSKKKIIDEFGVKTFFWKDSLKTCLENLSQFN
jgi:dTDP-4-dehydrorhamnose reductase